MHYIYEIPSIGGIDLVISINNGIHLSQKYQYIRFQNLVEDWHL